MFANYQIMKLLAESDGKAYLSFRIEQSAQKVSPHRGLHLKQCVKGRSCAELFFHIIVGSEAFHLVEYNEFDAWQITE